MLNNNGMSGVTVCALGGEEYTMYCGPRTDTTLTMKYFYTIIFVSWYNGRDSYLRTNSMNTLYAIWGYVQLALHSIPTRLLYKSLELDCIPRFLHKVKFKTKVVQTWIMKWITQNMWKVIFAGDLMSIWRTFLGISWLAKGNVCKPI